VHVVCDPSRCVEESHGGDAFPVPPTVLESRGSMSISSAVSSATSSSVVPQELARFRSRRRVRSTPRIQNAEDQGSRSTAKVEGMARVREVIR